MKCPKCGKDLYWIGEMTVLMKDTDKYFHRMSKKAFASKDIQLMGVNWEKGEFFCPDIKCGFNSLSTKRKIRKLQRLTNEQKNN